MQYFLNGVIKMVLKTRKSTKRSGKKVSTVFKVTAAYVAKFNTASEAKAAIPKISANTRAVIGNVRKSGNFYALPVKFVYYVDKVANKNAAVKTAKEKGAKVSVVTIKR